MAYKKHEEVRIYEDPPEFIAKCIECKRPSCNNCLKDAKIGDLNKAQVRKRHQEIIEQAKILRERGMYWCEVAKHLKISQEMLFKIRREAGV